MILDEYRKIITRRADEDAASLIVDHLRVALRPFRPGPVEIVNMFVAGEQRLYVFCRTFPDDVLMIDEDTYQNIARQQDIYYLANEIGILAGKHFGSIYTAPEDHIVLGEE